MGGTDTSSRGQIRGTDPYFKSYCKLSITAWSEFICSVVLENKTVVHMLCLILDPSSGCLVYSVTQEAGFASPLGLWFWRSFISIKMWCKFVFFLPAWPSQTHRSNKTVPPSQLLTLCSSRAPRSQQRGCWTSPSRWWGNLQYIRFKRTRDMRTCLRPLVFLRCCFVKELWPLYNVHTMPMRGKVLDRLRRPTAPTWQHRQAGRPCSRLFLPSIHHWAGSFLVILSSITENSWSFELSKTGWNWWYLLMTPE